MQEKFQNARWIIFKVGIAVAAVVVLWKLVVR
jgi:hypothetical protein